MKIRLTKIEELKDALHPNNKPINYQKEGYIVHTPAVGHSVHIYTQFGEKNTFSTSKVTEILPDNHFKTLSSIYKWEEIE